MQRALLTWQRTRREYEANFSTVPVVVRIADTDTHISFDRDAETITTVLHGEVGNYYDVKTDQRHKVITLTSGDLEKLHAKLGILILVESRSDE